ncbi:uncharacterized protein LOC116010583 isoform X3 [Ipomoea triloba]|nr:uncharacterized protein LOC116010583 isoform X3 [Ipomoea triloba]
MWCHDISHEQVANKPLLKTVFQVMMRLFSLCKTTLLFVIRDKTRTPLENLEPVLREDIQKDQIIHLFTGKQGYWQETKSIMSLASIHPSKVRCTSTAIQPPTNNKEVFTSSCKESNYPRIMHNESSKWQLLVNVGHESHCDLLHTHVTALSDAHPLGVPHNSCNIRTQEDSAHLGGPLVVKQVPNDHPHMQSLAPDHPI